MQRAMALGAEAERERRAKVIHAEGEFQASKAPPRRGGRDSGNPASLQLRYLQTLTEIGGMNNSTVVFPLPLDLIGPFVDALNAARDAAQAAARLQDGTRPELPERPPEAPRVQRADRPLTTGTPAR